MVDASQPHTDNQNHRQRQLFSQISRIQRCAKRDAKTAHTFNEYRIGLLFQLPETANDVLEINPAPHFLCGDMRCNGGVKQVRIDQFMGRLHDRSSHQRLNIVVAPLIVGSRRDWLHADRPNAPLL